jgi:hypothetical protein
MRGAFTSKSGFPHSQLLCNDLQQQSQRLVDAHVPPVEEARMLEAVTWINETTQKLYSTARGIVTCATAGEPGCPGAASHRRGADSSIQRRRRPLPRAVYRKSEHSPVEGPLAVTAYRVIQEALSNIVKHASCSLISGLFAQVVRACWP